jgi:hypothetical protein
MPVKIQGINGLSQSEIDFELQRGAKFVFFQYCISIVVLTFKRSSDIYFLRSGESGSSKGLPFTLLSLVAGWWGIPWGPIYTIQTVYNNLQGRKRRDATGAQLAARACRRARCRSSAATRNIVTLALVIGFRTAPVPVT